ncbi:homocysteine S-methyltransferase family protein [Angustibacter sp. McL0619]|uniref:homocysteine S-methyltransferase family protein n=1 Tax=Angustibacter sp. McL0619 TaxID=3415676 RepID=UPI003CE8DCC5
MPPALPQLDGAVLLTDSGLETDLIFHHDVDLPAFAAFTLLRTDEGRELLEQYFREHLRTAAAHGFGIILETPTWRASSGWAPQVGWSVADVVRANREAFDLVAAVRDSVRELVSDQAGPCVISGCAGPRGDGYVVTERMTGQQARIYHQAQVEAFAETDVALVSLLTISYPEEAIGFVQAAADAGVPSVASFTVEVDGRLPDGTPLGEAITAVDDATDGYAAYFMVNCAHPEHIGPALDPTAVWAPRLVGVRANASTRSHAELDEATELDDGDPVMLAAELLALRAAMPAVSVLGGCCGTDVRHIDALGAALRG